MRLNKFIAENTDYSRRKADELIKNNQVRINQEKAKLGQDINPKEDIVSLRHPKTSIFQEIRPKKITKIYIALNKPAGYITTRHDEFKRKTIMELVPQAQNLKPVGRLDKESEGLLLLSNDGEFINKMIHPSYECEKEYLVTINGKLEFQQKNKLEKGIKLEDKLTSPSKIKILKSSALKTNLLITIHEGRKRQIRKMFSLFGFNVEYLQRIRIGEIKLGDLKIGQIRHLTPKELHAFKSA